jgi:hypothetical protein
LSAEAAAANHFPPQKTDGTERRAVIADSSRGDADGPVQPAGQPRKAEKRTGIYGFIKKGIKRRAVPSGERDRGRDRDAGVQPNAGDPRRRKKRVVSGTALFLCAKNSNKAICFKNKFVVVTKYMFYDKKIKNHGNVGRRNARPQEKSPVSPAGGFCLHLPKSMI